MPAPRQNANTVVHSRQAENAHDASAVVYTYPENGIETDVQAVLEDLRTRVAALETPA